MTSTKIDCGSTENFIIQDQHFGIRSGANKSQVDITLKVSTELFYERMNLSCNMRVKKLDFTLFISA